MSAASCSDPNGVLMGEDESAPPSRRRAIEDDLIIDGPPAQ